VTYSLGTHRLCAIVPPFPQSVTMAFMRKRLQFLIAWGMLFMVGAILPVAARAQAPAAGSIEFQARIQPTGGRMEPVRSLPFYLLRKSVADIRKEAEQAEPPADLDAFVDGLKVSAELKSWMKKHHTVALSGTEFSKQLTADEITAVPEFLEAYTVQNGGSLKAGVPTPKFKESDRQSNPEKYKRDHDQYFQALRRYITAHPESTLAIDAQLGDSNPAQRWAQWQTEQQRKIERRSQILSQTTYLVAQADSDFDGRGAFRVLAPGTYWLTTLDTPAMAGDVRLQWDVPVQVAAGQTARIDLSNLNAIEPAGRPAR
jgi:hypothetical protein